MISNRPYLVRAFFQWIVDSGCTPLVALDATHPKCVIPKNFAENGEIVFNISPTAIRDLNISNDVVEFKASFNTVIYLISVPMAAILAIYAEENGEGLYFDADEEGEMGQEEVVHAPVMTSTVKSKPILTLVE